MIYLLELSTKTKIKIDSDDYEKFLNADSSRFVKLKQGIVNPSFVVSITATEEKLEKKVEGYIDEDTGKYVVTREEIVPIKLPDALVEKYESINENFKLN